MNTAEDIIHKLTSGERIRLILICSSDDSFRLRKQFVMDVLVGRIGWKIEGWDIMHYCMLITVAGNKLIAQFSALYYSHQP